MKENEMQPLPLEEVLARPQVLMDYYVKLSADKFIRVAKAGSNTPRESLERYRTKNLPCVYVRIEDYLRFVRATVNTVEIMNGVDGLSDSSRLSLLEEAMAAVYRETEAIGFDDEVFKHAKVINHSTLSFVVERPGLSDLVVKLAEASQKNVKHSMMVSLISTMLGNAHGWTVKATLEKLALGGLLHDIGKVKVPKEILSKPPNSWSNDERLIYASHAEGGKQILTQSKFVPDDVALIVLEHHERSDGTGFPQGLKDFQISPLARVVALANEFVKRIEEAGDTPNEAIVKRAIYQIESTQSQKFNKEALRALRQLLDKTFQATG